MLEIRCSVTKLVTGDVGTNESSGVTIGIRSTDRCVYEDQRDRDGARYRAPELRDRDLCQGFEHAILAELEAGIILPETRRALDIGRSMGTRQRRAMHHARLLRMR